MTDRVQKIKDWISKEQDGLMDAQGNFENPYDEGAFHILTNLDYYIDSLQEEPVSIWHDANQPPEINIPILVRTYDNIVESTKRYDDNLIPWEDRIKRDDITHWCYVEDLLKL